MKRRLEYLLPAERQPSPVDGVLIAVGLVAFIGYLTISLVHQYNEATSSRPVAATTVAGKD